jgi:hypothetical protein
MYRQFSLVAFDQVQFTHPVPVTDPAGTASSALLIVLLWSAEEVKVKSTQYPSRPRVI